MNHESLLILLNSVFLQPSDALQYLPSGNYLTLLCLLVSMNFLSYLCTRKQDRIYQYQLKLKDRNNEKGFICFIQSPDCCCNGTD